MNFPSLSYSHLMNPENFKYPTHRKIFSIGSRTYELELIRDLDEAIDLLCASIDPKEQMSVFAEDLCPYFGLLWDAGLALAHFIDLHHQSFKDKRVLELGAGVGLPSLVASHHGACVLTTDFHPQAEEYFTRNLSLNQLKGEYQRLNWREQHVSETFDIVMGSDILYEGKHALEVAEGLVRFLRPGGEIYLSDPGRAYLNGFIESMKRFDLKHQKIITRLNDKDYYLYRFYDYRMY